MSRLLVPLPNRDFDPTELCLPWAEARQRGVECVFATPDGQPAQADPHMLRGLWFGLLGARPPVPELYRKLSLEAAFRQPLAYGQLEAEDYDGLLLAGGHAPGMKSYLESETLRPVVRQLLESGKPVGAICHGPLVLARTPGSDGRSLLHGRKVTALPWILEAAAYAMTFWYLGTYYRTYPISVEAEVKSVLASPGQFEVGNPATPRVVEDGNLLTARWPLDAQLFARRLVDKVQSGLASPAEGRDPTVPAAS